MRRLPVFLQRLLPYVAAAAALLLLYQPVPSALEESIRNIPQGLFYGYGIQFVQ